MEIFSDIRISFLSKNFYRSYFQKINKTYENTSNPYKYAHTSIMITLF